nr:immunoglobulin heavy chain junction region [Macaca mulatta]MOW32277.1 immunoglobulin heavy chain junction region [Macaca mulatta]MOW32925.1 immunoglobulin heavy chain junction region [Macaca mulatta]MOW33014.1 immunoglobulin heavy chain junction region [Macaca mulatta]MOW33378.1 immunoglobulin heavy chain junction region [Macaca mulatta]
CARGDSHYNFWSGLDYW